MKGSSEAAIKVAGRALRVDFKLEGVGQISSLGVEIGGGNGGAGGWSVGGSGGGSGGGWGGGRGGGSGGASGGRGESLELWANKTRLSAGLIFVYKTWVCVLVGQ